MGHEDLIKEQLSCRVLTVSSSRTRESDESGRVIRNLLKEKGHRVENSKVIPDETEEIEREIDKAVNSNSRALIITGGTGLSIRDHSVDVLKRMEDKEIPGFGEAFRRMSFENIGPRAILSRARASLIRDTLVFSLPGSPAAVKLGTRELILPTIGHATYEIDKEAE
ncbi:molybdenum cofactor biosynthesis protein MoaB [Candidatus Bipolaricaulota bacterium]|nr:molybdenum cofactor biosynthesis protein MoaB [Candidatus Bipolaricaulota bacterium]MBS3825494.1 molybdenum cofactor biosynthesis protein MoaB [Candidatus Bipolaricaulota bacterium]